MARLQLTSVNTSLFTWNPETRTFSAEASDLPNNLVRPMYDDACDLGFELVSQRTGKRCAVHLESEHRSNDEDRELTHWTFKADHHSLDLSVVIFND